MRLHAHIPTPRRWLRVGADLLFTDEVPKEHRRQFESERGEILRSRLLALCAGLTLIGLMLASGHLSEFTTIIRMIESADAALIESATGFVFSLVQLTMIASVAWFAWRSDNDAERQLGLAFWLVVGLTALTIFSRGAVRIYVDPENLGSDAFMPALGLLWVHLLACAVLPWSMREAARPLFPILGLIAFITIMDPTMRWGDKALTFFLVALAGVPGLALCRWKTTRLRDQFHLRVADALVNELQRDLVDARKVHEALFPEPITEGPVRVLYRYEPMRQVGGDYLFARRIQAPDRDAPDLVVILLDVTGHGVGAALAVNRLHGEIERQLSRNPKASPADLLEGLDDYLDLALGETRLFASAVALRLGRAGRKLRWASAGHPPMLLRRSGGDVERLNATCTMLGVLNGDDFNPDEQLTILDEGDRLIIFTDGVTEATDSAGEMLGVEALQLALQEARPAPDDCLADTLLDLIRQPRGRTADDDRLIVELARLD